jgi:hypothetical protein
VFGESAATGTRTSELARLSLVPSSRPQKFDFACYVPSDNSNLNVYKALVERDLHGEARIIRTGSHLLTCDDATTAPTNLRSKSSRFVRGAVAEAHPAQ